MLLVVLNNMSTLNKILLTYLLTYKQYDVLPAYFKPMNTLRQLLVRLKDKILREHVVGPLWHIPCDSCDVPYYR